MTALVAPLHAPWRHVFAITIRRPIETPRPQTRVLVTVVWVLAQAISVYGQQPATIQRVAWLQGCWEMNAGTRTVEEHWMAPRGDSMLGMSRTTNDGRLVEFEQIVLRERADARLAFEARPSGQPPATFLSRTVSDSAVVFENPEHDFPQAIGYQRDGNDSLSAWIEGTRSGKTRRIDFRYRRVTCPGSR